MTVEAFKLIDATYLEVLRGNVDIDSDTFVAVLVTDAQTPSEITDLTYAQISANEIADVDYVALGEAGRVVNNLAWANGSNRNFALSCSNVDFAPGDDDDIQAKAFYIVRRLGGSLAPTDLILGYMILQTEAGMVSSTEGNFEVAPGTLLGIVLSP